jgi:hypothetical protein
LRIRETPLRIEVLEFLELVEWTGERVAGWLAKTEAGLSLSIFRIFSLMSGRTQSGDLLALGQVLIQPDAGLFTRPVGCAGLIKRTYERFDIGVEIPETLDSVAEGPTCRRVFVQKFLPFHMNYLWAHD